MVVADAPNTLMFNAFGEGYLCLLKRILLLSIRRLYFIYLLRERYMEKMLQGIFSVDFFERSYRSSDTKVHLDAALTNSKKWRFRASGPSRHVFSQYFVIELFNLNLKQTNELNNFNCCVRIKFLMIYYECLITYVKSKYRLLMKWLG